MRLSFLIALDIARVVGRTWTLPIAMLNLVAYMPFQQGLIDGWTRSAWVAMRLTLSVQALLPSVMMIIVFAEVIVPRKLRREMEPLLAAPVTDRELLLGHAWPMLALMAVNLVIGIPGALLGYRLAAGGYPADILFEIAFMVAAYVAVGTMVCGLMLVALTRCGSLAAFMVRALLPLAALIPLDLLIAFLRWAGLHSAALGVVLAAVAGGALFLWRVTGRLDREALLLR
ncbi:MAG: hypothetical protein ACREAA_19350 [Candidatus Polarisedimenticolia bacterium]